MATFQPPRVNDLPTILPETRGVQYRLWRHYGANPAGASVVKVSGVYTTIRVPTSTQLDAAGGREGTDFFLGGHVYTVTQTVGEALNAGGYSVTGLAPILRVGTGFGMNTTTFPQFTIPAAVELGDLMIVSAVTVQNFSFTGETGWTLVREAFNTGPSLIRLNVYSKVADAADAAGATHLWSMNPSSNDWGLAFTAWSGASGIDVHAGAGGASTSTSIVAPTITPTVAGTTLVGIFAGQKITAAVAGITVPAGTVQAGAPPSELDAAQHRHRQSSESWATATATGTRTATATEAMGWAAVHLALKA